MKTLTGRERLLNLLSGKPIDRIPVSPRVYQNVVYEHFESSNVDVVEGAIEFCRHFGIDIIDWNCTPHFAFPEFTLEGPYWKPRIRKEVSAKATDEITTVETPEPRYVLECYPAVFVLAALGAVIIREWFFPAKVWR